MRQTLSAIIAVAVLGAGCASLQQETRMYKGPFGRTEVGAVMIAADPHASKVLVETYDGDLWIYDVDAAARGRLSSLRVGDEVILAFDEDVAGTRAIAIDTVAAGRRALPPGANSIVDMLPMGVVFGASAVPAAVTASGTGGAVVYAPGGVVTGGIVGTNGTMVAGGVPLFGGGIIVPGFGTFSTLPAGVVAPQTAVGLGLVPGAFTTAPMGGPSVASAGGNFAPGRTPLSQGNFTPGTIAPGVTTMNPNAPGAPVIQGPFTPGTVAPGVSQQRGNAPPPAAGVTTGGSSGTTATPPAARRDAPTTTTAPPAGATGTTSGTSTGTTSGTATQRPAGTTGAAPTTARPAGTTAAPAGGTTGAPAGGATTPH